LCGASEFGGSTEAPACGPATGSRPGAVVQGGAGQVAELVVGDGSALSIASYARPDPLVVTEHQFPEADDGLVELRPVLELRAFEL
jgi:hypothetical protein